MSAAIFDPIAANPRAPAQPTPREERRAAAETVAAAAAALLGQPTLWNAVHAAALIAEHQDTAAIASAAIFADIVGARDRHPHRRTPRCARCRRPGLAAAQRPAVTRPRNRAG